MEMKKFINDFAQLFDDVDNGVFTPETCFHELEEYSSLMALGIIAMIDEEYGVQLRGDDIRGAQTIGALYDLVQSRR